MGVIEFNNSQRFAARLRQGFDHLDALDLMRLMIEDFFPGRIALVSSFGAESAVLLHMAAAIDRNIDVLFIDTGKLFGETKRYRDRLIERLKLSNVNTITPRAAAVQTEDAKGTLWAQNPDRCCYLRKVEPLNRALRPYQAWISGRKRIHGGNRFRLPKIEAQDGRIKVNPLADWMRKDLDAYFERHALPRHPLESDGYLSIGCMPCTDRVAPGEDARAGRWRGIDKNECGIHISGIAETASPGSASA